MSTAHATAWHEPDTPEDPRNDLLDALERLVGAIATDDAGKAAIEQSLQRILDSLDQRVLIDIDAIADTGLAPPHDYSANAAFEGAAAPAVSAPLATFTALELADLLTLMRDMRRAVRGSDGLQARIRTWRERVLAALQAADSESATEAGA